MFIFVIVGGAVIVVSGNVEVEKLSALVDYLASDSAE
jgi:hypothetical protein